MIKSGNYPKINEYIKTRNQYAAIIFGILHYSVKMITSELNKEHIYLTADEILTRLLDSSNIKADIESTAKYIYDNTKHHEYTFKIIRDGQPPKVMDGYYDGIYNKIEKEVLSEEKEIETKGDTASILLEYIIKPLNKCFLAAYNSENFNFVFAKRGGGFYWVATDEEIHQSTQRCAAAIYKLKEFQTRLVDSVYNAVCSFYIPVAELFANNDKAIYDIISDKDISRSAEIVKILSENDVPETDEKNLMIEMLICDPSNGEGYNSILDKYYDPDGELQRLASVMNVNVLNHIENSLMAIYNGGDISTCESTLEVKQQIIDAQAKYNLTDSKAYQSILYRQYFLELSDKAAEMQEEEIISAYTSIKSGNNTFVGDKGNVVDDDSCILILTRRFRKMNAAKYHDTIRQLGITDDTSSDKSYAFYEEGENYLTFEEECLKKIAADLIHDDDLSVQNYSDDKLASGEVILGYFQYTRALDFLTDGKCLVITNKRLYTLKEGFNDISNFIECKAVKKLLLTHLIIKMSDGKEIQLPVNKEIMDKAADMINCLVKALNGETYVKETSGSSQAISPVSSATSAVKQGLGSLFGRKNKTDSTWMCSCGSVNNGAFCPKCGTKRP